MYGSCEHLFAHPTDFVVGLPRQLTGSPCDSPYGAPLPLKRICSGLDASPSVRYLLFLFNVSQSEVKMEDLQT